MSFAGLTLDAENILSNYLSITAGEQIDESKRNLPDGREITFNKMNGGRTFPSLVVVARPNLCAKEIPPQLAQAERSELGGFYGDPSLAEE